MKLQLSKHVVHQTPHILITGSKSETNRLLLLQALYPNLMLENISNSDDSVAMQNGLRSEKMEIDIHHAGTAMRFLTAYYATKDGAHVVLKGSSRMHERPIHVLVDALRKLGAEIKYLDNDGFPPLEIRGKKILKDSLSIQANVSSQYLSAILLIAPQLDKGLKLSLEGEITSLPYLEMTLSLLQRIGVEVFMEDNVVQVLHCPTIETQTVVVESDWSSASYYYSIVAMSEVGFTLRLSSYHEDSLQGDRVIAELYQQFGVRTYFQDNDIILDKIQEHQTSYIVINMISCPDIAQTIAVTCLGLGITCNLTGLHTLKIKETDRLKAMQNELTKFGALVEITDDSLTMKPPTTLVQGVSVDTYQDHRMAMSFAPLARRVDLEILDTEVVTKSYPGFWEDIHKSGIESVVI